MIINGRSSILITRSGKVITMIIKIRKLNFYELNKKLYNTLYLLLYNKFKIKLIL